MLPEYVIPETDARVALAIVLMRRACTEFVIVLSIICTFATVTPDLQNSDNVKPTLEIITLEFDETYEMDP